MKTSMWAGILLFILGVLLALVELWFSPWEPELFMKLEITVGAFLLVIVVVAFVRREYKENKAIRSGDRLDE